MATILYRATNYVPDHRLGIAQLSNRLLIPPDALPFQGNPNGELLGYSWMALPFTHPTTGDPPTGLEVGYVPIVTRQAAASKAAGSNE